jgi:hypothetical protein
MKTLSIIVLALLINLQSKACWPNPIGWCSGKAYFQTHIFNNSSIFQFRIKGDTTLLFTYTTNPTGSTDTLFTVPQLNQNTPVIIQFRYKYIVDAGYNNWQSDTAGTGTFAGCGSLATGFTNLSAIKTGNNLMVQFNNENEAGVISYNIQLSTDTKKWVNIKSIPATNSHTYSSSVGIGITVGFMLPLLFISFRRKLFAFIFTIALITLFFSCKKSNTTNEQQYKYVRIEAVTNNGFVYSPIKSF